MAVFTVIIGIFIVINLYGIINYLDELKEELKDVKDEIHLIRLGVYDEDC